MTSIEWVVKVADAIGGKPESWNPVVGCSHASPGCRNCYAQRLAGTRLKKSPRYQGLTVPSKRGPVWTGAVRCHEDLLDKPLKWRGRRAVFVCDMGDLFHEQVPDDFLDRVFAVMALRPDHIFMVLTKRAARMRDYMAAVRKGLTGIAAAVFAGTGGHSGMVLARLLEIQESGLPLPNIWLGVSAEDQARADARIPHLLNTPAAVRFVSAEPLLGPVDLGLFGAGDNNRADGPRRGGSPGRLDWVIAGGESGPNARPMHPDWARKLRDDCGGAGVAFFFKQWGEYAPGTVTSSCDEIFFHFDGGVNYRLPAKTDKGHEEFFARLEVFGLDLVEDNDPEPAVYRVGRKAAGRKLDGKIHEQIPDAGDG